MPSRSGQLADAGGAARTLMSLAAVVGEHAQESRLTVTAMRAAVVDAQRRFAADVQRLTAEVENVQSSIDSLEMDLKASRMEREMAAAATMLPPTPGTATADNPPGLGTLTATAASGTLRQHAAAAAATIGSAPTPLAGTAVSGLAAHARGAAASVDAQFEAASEAELLRESTVHLHALLASGFAAPHQGRAAAAVRGVLEADGCGAMFSPAPAPSHAAAPASSSDSSTDDDDDNDRANNGGRRQRARGGHDEPRVSDTERGIVAVQRATAFLAVALGVSHVPTQLLGTDGSESAAEEAILTEQQEAALRPAVIAWLRERLSALTGRRGSSTPRSPRSPHVSFDASGPLDVAASPGGSDFGASLAVVGRRRVGGPPPKPAKAGRLVTLRDGVRQPAGAAAATMTVSSSFTRERTKAPLMPPDASTSASPDCASGPKAGANAVLERDSAHCNMPALHQSAAIAQGHYARLGNAYIHRQVARERAAQQPTSVTPPPARETVAGSPVLRSPLPFSKTPQPASDSTHYDKVINATREMLRERSSHPTAHVRQEVRLIQHEASLIGPGGKALRSELAEERTDAAKLLVPTARNSAGTLNDTSDVTRLGKAAAAAANTPEARAAAAAAAEAEAKRLEERRRQLGVEINDAGSAQPYFDGVGKGVLATEPANRILGRKLQTSAELVTDTERTRNRMRMLQRYEPKTRADVAPVVKRNGG